MELALAAAVICTAQIVRGTTGFGGALVALPVLGVLYGTADAILLVAVIDLLSGAALLYEVRRQVSWKLVAVLIVPTVLGMQLGATLLVVLPEVLLRIGLGLVVGGMGLRYAIWPVVPGEGELEALPDDPRVLGQAALAGTISGLMGGAVGAPGPPVAIWARRWFSDRFFRAQMIAWLQLTGLAIALTLVGRGLADWETLGRIPWLLPSVVVGALVGVWLSPRLPRDVFGRAVGLLLVGSGVALLGRALSSLAW